jgi:hypothetical protein
MKIGRDNNPTLHSLQRGSIDHVDEKCPWAGYREVYGLAAISGQNLEKLKKGWRFSGLEISVHIPQIT